ncbi:MAG: hypothetical protein ACYDHN_15060 [Solirubrobacteraceae bacterium]
MRLSFGRQDEQVIYLDEDVYVVTGDSARVVTSRSAWPATGSYGPIPRDGLIGRLDEVLGAIGPELWHAKRRGEEVCMVAQLATYDVAVALQWGADCVEHFARRVRGVDGNVVETLALARRYAREREFQPELAHRLASEAQEVLERLRKGGLLSLGRGLISRAGELDLGVGLLGPSETRYEAEELSQADRSAMQVALLHAKKELCGADPLTAGREAARWCRRASARNALAQEAGARATAANESSWLNLLFNPFASGTLARSLPGQVKAIQDGDIPETEWQAARMSEYLKRTDDEPLPPPWC